MAVATFTHFIHWTEHHFKDETVITDNIQWFRPLLFLSLKLQQSNFYVWDGKDMKSNFYSKKGSLKCCLWKIFTHQEKQKPSWTGNEVLLYW